MSALLVNLLLGLAVSFIGSLPPGIVSITVMDTAARKSFREGLFVAGAVAFLEFFQAFIAVTFSAAILQSDSFSLLIRYIAFPVFLIIGLYFFFKKNTMPVEGKNNGSAGTGIAKGFLVGMTNALVIPFWIFWSSYFAANGWMDLEWKSIAVFSAGVTAGAFLALMLYARLGLTLANKVSMMAVWGNKTIGVFFMGFAVFHLIKILKAI